MHVISTTNVNQALSEAMWWLHTAGVEEQRECQSQRDRPVLWSSTNDGPCNGGGCGQNDLSERVGEH